MKRMNLVIMAFAMLLTLSQCKKQEQAISETDETVPITLEIKENNGSRADVNPSVGTVVFTQGDVVYVSSGGKYVGTLTHNGNTFSGNITNPAAGQPLYFFFLGDNTPAETLTAGSSTQCSVVISDQTENLPVISCGPSNETFTGAGLYSAFFFNKCALVKFDVTSTSTSATCITGLNNKVTVNFANNGVAYDQEGNGLIKLSGGDGEKWAILLPQAAMEAGEEGSAYSEDGNCTGTRPAIPAIIENGYLTDGITVTLQAGDVPVGAINGLFTINENGDQVYFSQGNLQYIGSTATPYWKFADNQWDYFGTTTGQNSSDQNVDRDLFGWGTSGYNHNNACYQPWSTSTYIPDYYAWGGAHSDLYGIADWGFNAISNGGNTENSGWRTLTKNEWKFVFNERPSSTRFAKAKVNDVNGVILLPDNWASVYPLSNINGGSFSSNIISADDWINIFEVNGAVFLPTAGYRYGVSVENVNVTGNYWSASYNQDLYAYFVRIGGAFLYPNEIFDRHRGHSVHLVRDAE